MKSKKKFKPYVKPQQQWGGIYSCPQDIKKFLFHMHLSYTVEFFPAAACRMTARLSRSHFFSVGS